MHIAHSSSSSAHAVPRLSTIPDHVCVGRASNEVTIEASTACCLAFSSVIACAHDSVTLHCQRGHARMPPLTVRAHLARRNGTALLALPEAKLKGHLERSLL